MPTGTATIDFGAAETTASVDVTGQSSMTTANLVEAWIRPVATATNTADNHLAESLRIIAGNIVNGVGFTIYAVCDRGLAHGQYTVAWVWN